MQPQVFSARRVVVFLLLGVVIVLGAVAALGLRPNSVFRSGGAAGAGRGTADTGEVKRIEEATEAFANALLDFSVAFRDRDRPRIESLFASRLHAAPFPVPDGPPAPKTKWILEHGWTLQGEPREMWHKEFVDSIEAFAAHLSVIEDARFKVKESTVSADTLSIDAHLKFWVVGRDEEGRREWIRGLAEAVGRREEGGDWRIERFHPESAGSMVAGRDLFHEVGGEAGLTAFDPPVLEHPTLGLAAYGAAAADVDNDGLIDIFTTGHAGNALYLNNGDGTFRDAAGEARLKSLPRPGVAPLFLDIDNDGDSDLFISSLGEQFLFENRLAPEGRLMFRDISLESGVSRQAVGFSAAAGDINGDGLPDIYVASYNMYGAVMPDSWDAASNGTPNLLFINGGDGTFREAAAEWGAEDARWSYAAQFADVDDDGDLDLYVANDFGGGNSLLINSDGRFQEAAEARGAADHGYAMGISFGDYDNDGDLDLHVTRMSSTAGRRILSRMTVSDLPSRQRLEQLAVGNALYENAGGGHFRNVSATAGPFSGGWAWGGGFWDFDNDGWTDLHTPNGFLSGSSLKDT